jgi:replicative DNA helicase
MQTLASTPRGTLVIIDYLQLLDQKRENPPLADQVRALKAFAKDRGLVIVFISQIDRSYDPSKKPYPDIQDVRLPNPLDLKLFSKTCFLSNGDLRIKAVS